MSFSEYKIILVISTCALFVFLMVWFVCFLLSRRKVRKTSKSEKNNHDMQNIFPVYEKSVDEKISGSVAQLNELVAAINVFTGELESTVNEFMRKADAKERALKQLLKETEVAISRLDKARRYTANSQLSSTYQTSSPEKIYASVVEEKNNDKVDNISIENPAHKLLSGNYKKVLDLYSQGIALAEISRQLSMDKGKVELICNLQKKLQ